MTRDSSLKKQLAEKVSKGKKTVIMEMEEEYSVSDVDEFVEYDPNKELRDGRTWQDLQEENG